MPLLSVADAKARIDALLSSPASGPLPSEAVPLDAALAEGRVLRQAVEADADSPPFDRSAMDGYAIAERDPGAPYRVVGSVRAGEVFSGGPLAPGTCVRIFTGGQVPEGTVRVIMQEDAVAEGDTVRFAEAAFADEAPTFVRRRGEEYLRGARLLGEGIRIGPVAASVLATVGVAFPQVSARPRVAHFVTGGELVPVGAVPGAGQIRDSNSSLVAGLVAAAGGRLVRQARVGDDQEALRRALALAVEEGVDLLLISGGAGAGETDFGRTALEEAGYAIDFAGVALRPGKPLLFGAHKGSGKPAFCLPGNPLSHYVVFHLFVRRALERLQGMEPTEQADLVDWDGDPLGEAGGRETYHPCHWKIVSGRVEARVLNWTSSGHLASLGEANGLLVSGGGDEKGTSGNPRVRLVRWS
ncbi:MAG TPA: molybdopterin molybdotransferase MoeA [Candidatus Methylacidiphilales bacterium]